MGIKKYKRYKFTCCICEQVVLLVGANAYLDEPDKCLKRCAFANWVKNSKAGS